MTVLEQAAGFDTSTPQKAWASQRLRGLVNLLFPSYLEDGVTLDEDGVRLDVEATVAHGFVGTMPLLGTFAADDPQWERFARTVVDAAGGRLLVQGAASAADPRVAATQLSRLEALGYDFMGATPTGPTAGLDAESLHEAYATRIRATELPVTLYAPVGMFARARAEGHLDDPIDLFDRLADLPNVVGIKMSHPVPLEIQWRTCERIADRVLVAPVNLDFALVLARQFQIQWTGQWNGEAVQTRDRQLAKELLGATAARDLPRAAAVYDEMQPVLDHFYWLQAPAIRGGVHPHLYNKYYAWLTGGNGGLLPTNDASHLPVLDAAARRGMRDAFARAGLAVTEAPDEEFVVGRAAWARGTRPDGSRPLPGYSRS